MWLLLSLFFVFLGTQTPPVASSEDLNNLMGRNVRKGPPEKNEVLPKTPPSKEDELSRPTKPKPKPKPIKPAPTPPGNQKKQNKPNEKEVQFSLPMKELSNTQVNKMLEQAALGHAGKSTPTSTQYDFAIDGSPSRGQAKSSAIIRAQEVRSKLDPQFPSFVKSLLRSHVASCFWMGLPSLFCKSHLPEKDITMTLEDESGKQLQSKYIACKTGLSAGWRQFAASHKLLEGDVLVFQLVEPAKFKVYVIRSNDFTEVDGALGILNLEAQTKQNDADKEKAETGAVACHECNRKRAKSPPLVVQKKKKMDLPAEHSENDSEEVDSEVVDSYRLPGTALQFEDIKGFENFSILVNGLLVDSEFPEDIRRKYYKLCCSQNAFLHENVVKGTNYKLIVGAIVETVNIVDAIKACKLTTTQDDFVCWEKYLRAFELLGMNVGFIRARLCRLANLAFDSEDAMDAKIYKEARKERARAGLGIRNIETRIQELREACHEFSSAIESLRSKAEVYTHRFKEEVTAPW